MKGRRTRKSWSLLAVAEQLSKLMQGMRSMGSRVVFIIRVWIYGIGFRVWKQESGSAASQLIGRVWVQKRVWGICS